MYHYQPLQHVQTTQQQQQQQPAALAHLLPQLQHLEPGNRTGQGSSSNSLAAALIPNTTPTSSQQHQQVPQSSLQHNPDLLHHQLQQQHGHTNQLVSMQYSHNNGYVQAQQGTRIVDELEMPPLDGWPGSGPSSGSGLGHNRHFQFQQQNGHIQTAVAYHNPRPTYPMMHDAVSDTDSQPSYAHSMASNATSGSEGLLFGYVQGEEQTMSASASDSSAGAGIDAAVGGVPHAADEPWPDPRVLMPLGMDARNVLGGMGMGMGYGGDEIQFAMNVGGGMEMEGWNGMGGMGNVDLGVAYDMGFMGVGPSGYSAGPGFGGLALQEQIPMQMAMGYNAGGLDGSGTGTGQDGWMPIHNEDSGQHHVVQPRPLSASSSVGSGSNSASGSGSGSTSSLAHANTYIPSPPPGQGQAQGPEQGQDVNNISTYHSHGVQIASQQQQQHAGLQEAYHANSELLQAHQPQQVVSYPPQQHEQSIQDSSLSLPPPPPPQPQSQNLPSAQPSLPAAPPKLLPGQTGMLPPPDIPVRRKVGRPRGAKSAKNSRTYPTMNGNARASGSSERPMESTQPIVPSSVPSVVANKAGYVYPQVSQPPMIAQHAPRSQSVPDLQHSHIDSHGQVEVQGYSRNPLAHRYSDEDIQRAREQAERERQQQAQQSVNQSGKSTATSDAQVRSSTDVSSSSSATIPEQVSNGSDVPEASSGDKAPEANADTKPKAPYAHATMSMADGQWAIAQECNRAALTETFRLRHGRDPPPSMNILETSALERSTRVEKALVKAVDSDMKEVEERNRRARDQAEAARRSWCGENADNHADSQEQVESPTVDPDFWTKPLGPEWTPAQPGIRWRQASTAGIGQQQLVSPLSPNTPDEAITPLDALFPRSSERASSSHPSNDPPLEDDTSPSTTSETPTSKSASGQANAPSGTNPPSTDVQTLPTEDGPYTSRLRHIIRHDGHLPHHVSGLGGTYSEAYDGRSYLPDDAEPYNVPQIKPPNARMGDHPLLQNIRPHPLHIRGEKWHALANPNPDERFKTAVIKDESVNEKSPGDAANEHNRGGLSMIVDHSASGAEPLSDLQTISKKDFESLEERSEQGDGYGFPEGGSLGPGLGLQLPGLGDDADGAASRRLKLSTEKKAPPKMACLFCRNRKIACGVGTGEDKTCNQCLRRALRCIYPTESRRGMRVRKPRSAHTVDGVDEADKDGMEDDDDYDPVASPTTGPSSSKGKKPKKAKRGRGRPPRQPRAQDDGAEEDERNREGAMDSEDRNTGDMQVDQDYQEANDPLASLAAEDRRQELQWVHQHPPDMNNMGMGQEIDYSDSFGSALSPSAARPNPPASATTPASSGPFTTSPLHRRPGRPSKRAVRT